MIALAALLAAAAVWCWLPGAQDPRLARIVGTKRMPTSGATSARGPWPLLAGVVLAIGVWLLVGGLVGGALAIGCVVVVPRIVVRLEPRSARARRDDLGRQAPLLADLLSATLASGATVRDALEVSSDAVGPPTREVVRPVVVAIDLGADPQAAWQAVGVGDAHREIVDALARAQRSGAPIAQLLAQAADDLRRERRREVEVAARSAGVRAVAPLAACFLPAFLLLGVVPVIASLVDDLAVF